MATSDFLLKMWRIWSSFSTKNKIINPGFILVAEERNFAPKKKNTARIRIGYWRARIEARAEEMEGADWSTGKADGLDWRVQIKAWAF